MVKAFIMVKLGTSEYMGLARTVLEKLSEIPSVTRAYAIFGRYDLIAEVEVESLSTLTKLTQDKLRALDGVLSTETFIAHEQLT